MKVRASLLYFVYLVFSIFVVSALSFILLKNNYKQSQKEVKEFTNTSKAFALLTENDFQKLEAFSIYFVDTTPLEIQITDLYNEVVNAPVCSIANRNFNLLEEVYIEYEQQVLIFQGTIILYEAEYNKCLEKISQIPKYSKMYNNEYTKFIKKFGKQYEFILKKNVEYSAKLKELHLLYIDAQQIADNLFNEYYNIMCHIINAEAGICGFTERCYVANVIENRIASTNFPNTIYDVVFQPGQYEPVMTGTYYQTPSQSIEHDMEEYLRGRFETGMPNNVFYQALFKQGNIWKKMPSGHYFCY